ncbi:hypothetical protein J6590_025444 [Homalodisca vitripennis]|nr:hypothetical protein J6590_025444 [Homalodisca vitripennis]
MGFFDTLTWKEAAIGGTVVCEPTVNIVLLATSATLAVPIAEHVIGDEVQVEDPAAVNPDPDFSPEAANDAGNGNDTLPIPAPSTGDLPFGDGEERKRIKAETGCSNGQGARGRRGVATTTTATSNATITATATANLIFWLSVNVSVLENELISIREYIQGVPKVPPPLLTFERNETNLWEVVI